MAGILLKGTKSYDYYKAARGSSFIRLYDEKGYCFRSFLDITPEGFGMYSNFVLADSYEEGKTYYTRNGEKGSYSFTVAEEYSDGVYELVEIFNCELDKVVGIGTIAAESGNIIDKKLTLTLPAGTYIQNGLIINFRTPVASCDLAHVVIEGKEYALLDADNNSVSNYHSAFAANSIVSIIIDIESNTAVVNNLKFSNNLKVSTNEPNDIEDIELWVNPNGTGIYIDETVTEGSTNLITSGAVYEAIKNILLKLNLD